MRRSGPFAGRRPDRGARGRVWAQLGLLVLGLLLGAVLALAQAPATRGPLAGGAVLVLELDGVIGPASADFIHRGLARAQRDGARLVVLQMDTPGGLDSSMRLIIKDILASPIPVATFVAPEGARAASAGTYILYASHIAAMAPATNLGAATPVALGGPPGKPGAEPAGKEAPPPAQDASAAKAINDAVAYLQSLAQLRGRDATFAEQAVREARSLAAEDALKRGVIEFIAPDVPALLAQVSGREVKLAAGAVRLDVAGAAVERLVPDWRNRLLALISNPTLALVLMMVGIYGLFVEFTTPGFGVPGVAGAIALLLALYSLQLLPVNWAGLALVLLGAALMIGEVLLPSFGVLGVGGVIAFVVGGLMLYDDEAIGYGIPLAWLVAIGMISATLIVGVGTVAMRVRKRPVVSGREELTGMLGVVESAQDGRLWVRLHGELWQARLPAGATASSGQAVRVRALDGLLLEVEPVATPPPGESAQRR